MCTAHGLHKGSRHGAGNLADVVLANNRFDAIAPPGWLGEPVRLRWPPAGGRAQRLVLEDLVDRGNAHHHDPERLATAILAEWDREGGRRRRPRDARDTRMARGA